MSITIAPGLAGLVEFCELIDEPLHPHEKRIARAYFGPAREIVAILPRGNAKTTLAAQDRAAPPAHRPRRRGHDRRRQPRSGPDRVRADARLRAAPRARRPPHDPPPRAAPRGRPAACSASCPSDGAARPRPLQHALHRRRGLGVARRRRAARGDADRPDQAPRQQAAADLHRRGAARQPARPAARPRARPADREAHRRRRRSHAATCTGSNGRVPDDVDLDDLDAVKQCEPGAVDHRRRPAPAARRRARDARSLSSTPAAGASARGHGCRPGAWQACVGEPDVHGRRGRLDRRRRRRRTLRDRRRVGQRPAARRLPRSTTATAASSRPSTTSARSPARYNVRELVYDPWRFGQAAQELEREGMLVVAFPQHDARMIPASAPPARRDRRAAPHAPRRPRARPPRRPTRSPATRRRGWRIDKPNPRANIDAVDRARDGRRARRGPARARRAARMALKPCLGCGRLTTGSRCPPCRRASPYQQPAWRRLSASSSAATAPAANAARRTILAAHHVIPRAEGGADHPSNLVALCASCHARLEADRRATGVPRLP